MTTVRELILQNIKTTLEGISIANGYNNDFENVQRYDVHNSTLVNLPCIIMSVVGEEKQLSPHPFFTCTMRVSIDVFFTQAEDDTTSTYQYINSFLGDVEKAIMQDVYRGSLADNTIITGNEAFEIGEKTSFSGVIIDIEIQYKHKYNDPEARF